MICWPKTQGSKTIWINLLIASAVLYSFLFLEPIGCKLYRRHYSSHLRGLSEARVHNHCRRFPIGPVNSGRMQSALGILACGFLIGIPLKSSGSLWVLTFRGIGHYAPMISNTALIQMIHHGDASQMKPVIYHRVRRLKQGFFNCGLGTLHETGPGLGSIRDSLTI